MPQKSQAGQMVGRARAWSGRDPEAQVPVMDSMACRLCHKSLGEHAKCLLKTAPRAFRIKNM